jgi:hypothetical protein
MKLKEILHSLLSMFTPKGDKLYFPSEEEVAQHNKRLQDRRKAKELECVDTVEN